MDRAQSGSQESPVRAGHGMNHTAYSGKHQGNADSAEVSGSLLSLPDDILSRCMQALTVHDLLVMETVSRRLRQVVINDPVCWKQALFDESGRYSNYAIIERAAQIAGGYKQLYSARLKKEKEHRRWINATEAETLAAAEAMVSGLNTKSFPSHVFQWVHGSGPNLGREPTSVARAEGGVDDSFSSPNFSRMSSFATSRTSSIGAVAHPTSTLDFSGAIPLAGQVQEVCSGFERSLSAGSSIMSWKPNLYARELPLTVLVILDGSSSISDDDFSVMKNFSILLFQRLGQMSQGCRAAYVGLLQFNQSVSVVIPLSRLDLSKNIDQVKSTMQCMGSTDIAQALQNGYDMLVQESLHHNAIMVLVSDGQIREQETVIIRDLIKNKMDSLLCTVGVGRDVDEEVLYTLANDSKQSAQRRGMRGASCYFGLRRWREIQRHSLDMI